MLRLCGQRGLIKASADKGRQKAAAATFADRPAPAARPKAAQLIADSIKAAAGHVFGLARSRGALIMPRAAPCKQSANLAAGGESGAV